MVTQHSSMALEQRVQQLLERIEALENAGGGGGGGAGFVDSSAGDVFATLTDLKTTVDYSAKPQLNITSDDPEFMLTLTAKEGQTSTPVIVIESVGSGNGGSLEFMAAQGVGGAIESTEEGDILGNIYYVSAVVVDGEVRVIDDGVTITVVASVPEIENDAPPASYEIKTRGLLGKAPRVLVDFDGDTQIQNGKLIIESHAPAAADSVGKAGTVTWDADNVYVCIATDTWMKAPFVPWV